MKTFGIIGLILGLLLGFYGLFMDTSVEVPNYSDSLYSTPHRVNNLGLMSMQQNLIVFSGFIFLAGLLMTIFGGSKNNATTIHKFQQYEEKANRAEYKGNISEAIDNYMDALYHLETDYKNLSKPMEENRRQKVDELKIKVSQLKRGY